MNNPPEGTRSTRVLPCETIHGQRGLWGVYRRQLDGVNLHAFSVFLSHCRQSFVPASLPKRISHNLSLNSSGKCTTLRMQSIPGASGTITNPMSPTTTPSSRATSITASSSNNGRVSAWLGWRQRPSVGASLQLFASSVQPLGEPFHVVEWQL